MFRGSTQLLGFSVMLVVAQAPRERGRQAHGVDVKVLVQSLKQRGGRARWNALAGTAHPGQHCYRLPLCLAHWHFKDFP